MNNSNEPHSNITVDSLSYKELQGLAMSLNLPGKMKQGVLVEAIKARQNHNEQAVTMILEANRQRRIIRRQQQQQLQQQQLLKLNNENNKRAKTVNRSRMKRSASEMEMDSLIEDENLKRSKLAAALISQRRMFHNPLPMGVNPVIIRREQQAGSCSTWEHPVAQQHNHMTPPPIVESSPLPTVPVPIPILPKPLPDLSKDPSILPTLSDCSGGATPSPGDDGNCCSVGSVSSTGSWSSLSTTTDNQVHQTIPPQSSFESGCDSGWLATDESYDLNTWKSLPNIKLSSHNVNNYGNVVVPSSTQIVANNVSSNNGYFETDMFINNSDMYRAEDFISNNMATTTDFGEYPPATGGSIGGNQAQQQQQPPPPPPAPAQPTSDPLDSNYLEMGGRTDQWCDSSCSSQQLVQHSVAPQIQQQQQFPQQMSAPMDFRLNWNNPCCYDQMFSHFRLQRPGNPSAVFVPSGRSLTLSTYCNMLPRVASYVQ